MKGGKEFFKIVQQVNFLNEKMKKNLFNKFKIVYN